MAISGIITFGVPGEIKYLITFGIVAAAAPVPTPDGDPTYSISDLFDGPFHRKSDFTNFIDRWETVIAEAALYSAADLAFLDIDGSGTIDYDDMDMHLHVLGNRWMPVDERLPDEWDEDDDSDPLGLLDLRGGNTVIIDPYSNTAVNVTQSANTCLNQNGTSAGNLFSGDDYLQTLWKNLLSLDEVGNSTIRRFPTNGGKVTIYVRGGTQEVTNELRLLKGTGSWTALDRITVRAYGWEKPKVHCCNSEYTTAPAARIGKWRFDSVIGITTRPNLRWFDIDLVGYVDKPFGRVFAPAAVISFGGGSDGFWLRGGSCVDNLAIPSNNSNANRLRTLVDATFLIRSDVNGSTLPASTVGQGRTVTVNGTSGKIENYHLRPSPINFPYVQSGDDDVFNSEGLDIEDCDGIEIINLSTEGTATHAMVRLQNTSNFSITHCDLKNLGHTVLLANNDDGTSGTGYTIEYNRIHHWAQVSAVNANGMQLNGVRNSTIRYNSVYNNGLEFTFSAGISLNATIGSANDTESVEVSHNSLYHCGLAVEYTSTASGGIGANKLYDITIDSNVIFGVPTANQNVAYYGAPLRLGLDQPLSNNAYGITITNNVLVNEQGTTVLATSTRGNVTTNYTVGSTTFPGFTDNVTLNPRYLDIGEEDFLMGNATAQALVEGAPLRPRTRRADTRPGATTPPTTSTRSEPAITGMSRV